VYHFVRMVCATLQSSYSGRGVVQHGLDEPMLLLLRHAATHLARENFQRREPPQPIQRTRRLHRPPRGMRRANVTRGVAAAGKAT
jgi:hypothetical protein